jgi:hypothetical protein
MSRKEKITVQGTEITIISDKNDDYISLTDMANAKAGEARAADIIKNWIRHAQRSSLSVLGNNFTIQVLKWSNLTTLKCRQACQVSF